MICPYSLAVWGGVQAQVLGLSRSLRRSGIDVQVLAPCDGHPPEPWVTPLGDSIPYAQNGSFAPLAPDVSAQLRVLGAIWDQRFDLLHLHEPLAPGPTLTAALVKPVPLIGTFHASGDIFAYRWGRPMVRWIADRLDLRTAVSPEASSMAERYLGGSYEILFNGVETSRYRSGAGLAARHPTVMFVGRHEPRKGLSILLEAARWLPSDVRFWIAGDGPETESLRSRFGDDSRIEWLGALSEAEKVERLKAASVFCVPSLRGESFGIVLLEGMAAGVPVVASDLSSYRVVARNGRDAKLFPPGDSRSLAAALQDAMERGPEVERRIMAGLERSDEYSMDNLAIAYAERYDRLVTS